MKKLAILLILFMADPAFSAGKVKTIQLQVEGMVSNACPVILKSVVNKIEGVQYVEANLENHSAVVRFDPEKTTESIIQEKIHDQAGFSTKID